MSYKDGIPLLASFEDDVDEEDLTFQNVRPSRCRCSKRTIMFSLILGLAIGLVIALIVGVTVPVVLLSTPKPSSANTGSGIQPIHNQTSSDATGLTSLTVTVTGQTSQIQPTRSMSSPMSSQTQSEGMSLGVSPTAAATSLYLSTVVPRPTPSWGQGSTVPTAVTSVVPRPTPSSGQGSTVQSAVTSVALSPTPSSGQSPTSSIMANTSSSRMVTMNATSVILSPTTSYSLLTSIVTPTPSSTPLPPSDQNCTHDDIVCRSTLDDRSYQVTMLSNGLRVLLISDPNSNLSAAAMDIPAGSFNDPKDYEGLAHFCEHMLFIGTGKYPDLNQYSNFLQTHGGYDNAYTSTQNTNYFFNVQADYFSQALDMFAHFFIDPLFSEGSVMDEMNAVNAEHQKNLQNDGWKIWQLLKNVSNPAHPFSQFNTGSLETLNKSGVHEELWHYYNSSYSANTMQLVVYGRDNLTTLLDTVRRSFTAIPNRNVTKATYNTTSFPPPLYSGFIVHYYPVADKDTLTIMWQVTPSLEPFYRHAVGSFVTGYLGRESEHSLANRLKHLNYVTSLSAYVQVETDSYTLFSVELDLTDTGVGNASDVIQMLYQDIDRFRTLDPNGSDLSGLWEDFVSFSQIRFDYSERDTPINYVSAIASTMRTVSDPADFLNNPRRYEACYNLTLSTLSQFTPNNSLVFLGTHKITFTPEVAQQLNYTSDGSPPPVTNVSSEVVQVPWPELDTIEPIYLTPFHREKISDELLSYWANVNGSYLILDSDDFIPSDFTVIQKPSNSSNVPYRLDNLNNQAVLMWTLLDTQDFPAPRVNLMCMLNNTNADITPAWEARSRLFARFIEAVLQPELYYATLVGYTYSVQSYSHGLMLSFSGLSGSMSNVISTVAGSFNKNSLVQQGPLFNTAKDGLIDELQNYNFTNLAFRYTYRYLQQVVMERPYWTNEQILDELVGLNFTEVLNFGIDTLLNGAGTRLLCLAHGNVDNQTAQQYASTLSQSRFGDGLLSGKPFYQSFGHYWQHRVSLSEPGNYSVVMPTLNPEDKNSVVNVVFQVGEMCDYDGSSSCSQESLLRSLHLSLLTQMLNDECFTYLRTTNKLGYVAYCLSRSNENVGSFQVLVQSEAYDSGYVLEKISDFLEDYVLNVVFSPENNFTQFVQDQKDVLKSTLIRKDLTLNDRTKRLWNYIQHGQLTFDLRHKQIDLLDSINSTSVRDFYMEHVVNSNTYRKMIIVVNGKDRDFQPSVTNPLDYADLPDCLTYPSCGGT